MSQIESLSANSPIDSGLFDFHTSTSPIPVNQSDAHLFTFSQLFTSPRREEQKSHFLAIVNAVSHRKKVRGLSTLPETTISITAESLATEKQQRILHLVCRLAALDPTFPQENLFEKVEEACQHIQSIEEICSKLGITVLLPGHRLLEKFYQLEQQFLSCNIDAEKAFLNDCLQSLDQLLKLQPEEIEDLENTNLAILKNLRSLYSSPLYKALCTSPENPFIDVLHAIAIEQYTNTPLKIAFEKLGRQLDAANRPLHERVQTIWDRFVRSGITDTIMGTLLHESFYHFFVRILPFLLNKVRQAFFPHCRTSGMIDERSLLRNTPGTLIDEIQPTRTMQERKVRTIMLAAPTVGSEVTPEFCAALQALENNQFSPFMAQYSVWAYTNLQDFSSMFEHHSSIALMLLQEEYPLSFRAITLNQKGSPLQSDSFSQEDVAHHLSLIFNDHSSSIENRGHATDAGYYFPVDFLKKRRAEIEDIAQRAFRIVEEAKGSQTPSTLKNAYMRLLHLGLTRLHEIETFELSETRTHKPQSTIRSTICASCVDRGGVMNTSYLHALDPAEEFKSLTSGTLFGRALFNHRRIPQHTFVRNLTDLFGLIPLATVHAFLSKISPGRLVSEFA